MVRDSKGTAWRPDLELPNGHAPPRPAAPTPRVMPSLVQHAVALAIDSPRDLTEREARDIGYVPSGGLQRLSSGLQVVHLRQHHLGVPLIHAGRSVRFDDRGAFLAVTGRPARVELESGVEPRRGPIAAAKEACRHVVGKLSEPSPELVRASTRRAELIAEFGDPSRPTVLSNPPFGNPIVARLTILGAGPEAALAWEVRLRLPEAGGTYAVFVDASARRPVILDSWRGSACGSQRPRLRVPSDRAERSSDPNVPARPPALPELRWASAPQCAVGRERQHVREQRRVRRPLRQPGEGGDDRRQPRVRLRRATRGSSWSMPSI